MTTENVTINLDYKVEIPESVRDDLKKLFGVKDEDVLTSLPYANWPRAVQELLFSGTEAVNGACCGEPEDCAYIGQQQPVGTWWTPDYAKPEGIDVSGNADPESVVPGRINLTRSVIAKLIDTEPMDEQVLQYVLEADQALEDAQIHIADQAERAKLQEEEDLIVDEWRIAIMKASNVTKQNFTDWKYMAEDTKRMWRERFYGNLEWLENFAKGDK